MIQVRIVIKSSGNYFIGLRRSPLMAHTLVQRCLPTVIPTAGADTDIGAGANGEYIWYFSVVVYLSCPLSRLLACVFT